jgi:hypothetical protein
MFDDPVCVERLLALRHTVSVHQRLVPCWVAYTIALFWLCSCTTQGSGDGVDGKSRDNVLLRDALTRIAMATGCAKTKG